MMMKHQFTAIIAIATSAIVLTGCGDSSGDDDSTKKPDVVPEDTSIPCGADKTCDGAKEVCAFGDQCVLKDIGCTRSAGCDGASDVCIVNVCFNLSPEGDGSCSTPCADTEMCYSGRCVSLTDLGNEKCNTDENCNDDMSCLDWGTDMGGICVPKEITHPGDDDGSRDDDDDQRSAEDDDDDEDSGGVCTKIPVGFIAGLSGDARKNAQGPLKDCIECILTTIQEDVDDDMEAATADPTSAWNRAWKACDGKGEVSKESFGKGDGDKDSFDEEEEEADITSFEEAAGVERVGLRVRRA